MIPHVSDIENPYFDGMIPHVSDIEIQADRKETPRLSFYVNKLPLNADYSKPWMTHGFDRGTIYRSTKSLQEVFCVRSAFPVSCGQSVRIDVHDSKTAKVIDTVEVQVPVGNDGDPWWSSDVVTKSATLKKPCYFKFTQPLSFPLDKIKPCVPVHTILWLFDYGTSKHV